MQGRGGGGKRVGRDRSSDWDRTRRLMERKKRASGDPVVVAERALGADVDNKAGDKRYLLRVDNLSSLKCIRISQRELEPLKKLSALTRRPGMDKRAPGGLNQ